MRVVPRVGTAAVGVGAHRPLPSASGSPCGKTAARIPIHRLEARLSEDPSMRMVLPEGGWPPPKPHELHIADRYFENPDGRGYGHEFYVRARRRAPGRCRRPH